MSVLKILAYIITGITARPMKLTVIIMSVSTFKTGVILYLFERIILHFFLNIYLFENLSYIFLWYVVLKNFLLNLKVIKDLMFFIMCITGNSPDGRSAEEFYRPSY